jgi:threonine/homoserine/homoserine lactone efflux protein
MPFRIEPSHHLSRPLDYRAKEATTILPRDISTKAPNIWNGIAIQLLNPKYPPVVLSVFAASPDQNAILTAGILTVVGMAGLTIYAATGAVIHRKVNLERQLRTVDFVFGVLLCLVGFWLMVQPDGG